MEEERGGDAMEEERAEERGLDDAGVEEERGGDAMEEERGAGVVEERGTNMEVHAEDAE
jgi:hypothetical protein